MIKWKGIVVHHTKSHDVSIETIKDWHVKERGWPYVGYHFLIKKNGSIEEGCNLNQHGIHARDRNHTHIGIALTGCFSGDAPNHKTEIEPSSNQILSLKNLLEELCDEFKISPLKIERHHKDCPGDRFDLESIVRTLHTKEITSDVELKLETMELQAIKLIEQGLSLQKEIYELRKKL